MNVKKCDICHKIIKDDKGLNISLIETFFKKFELCMNCAKPIMKFLKTKKLIKKEKSKKI